MRVDEREEKRKYIEDGMLKPKGAKFSARSVVLYLASLREGVAQKFKKALKA